MHFSHPGTLGSWIYAFRRAPTPLGSWIYALLRVPAPLRRRIYTFYVCPGRPGAGSTHFTCFQEALGWIYDFLRAPR